ncbi:MAG: hypothetical protein REI94_03700 [Moraxellaceae bacterium]|nr:hypothetical protein [Moraxellaceae bacterium]
MPGCNCVEPANEAGLDRRVVSMGATDQITFPAVNSCFAIGVVLADGSLLGGHVPMYWDTPSFSVGMSLTMVHGQDGEAHQMQASLARIVNEINGLRNGRDVSAVVTLGDVEWVTYWDAMLGHFGYPKEIRYRKNAGTCNLILDGALQMARVQRRLAAAAGYSTVGNAARNFSVAARPATRVDV